MTPWTLHSRRPLVDLGKYLKVELHEVFLPDGGIIPDWPVVITPDYVNILAEDTEGRFVLFRQTKYMAPEMRLAPPGGYLEPGESPLEGARRELLEETGYESTIWIDLGSYVVDSNRGCGNAHLFLARNAVPTTAPQSDDLEEQRLVLLTRTELDTAIASRACPILSAMLLFTLALRQLD